MHVYRNRVVEWFIAESVEHARELAAAYGEDYGVDESEIDLEFTQEPDDKPLRIFGMDAGDDDAEVTKTCAEWAASEPVGFLCSTEY